MTPSPRGSQLSDIYVCVCVCVCIHIYVHMYRMSSLYILPKNQGFILFQMGSYYTFFKRYITFDI